MKKSKEVILKMITSPDKDNSYLAACILRTNPEGLTARESKQLLNKIPIIDRITCYEDICLELKEQVLIISHFLFLPEKDRKKALAYVKLQQIARLVNGTWVPNWDDTSQYKWYPYFRTGQGLVFGASGCSNNVFGGLAAYFKDRETSDFVGKTFINLYEDLT